ncbi:uncharacterized protein LOC62_06G008282 [Vanrija pseudolonga]|uniref:Uncharacterized protein n=1 Tax=Vanrija pseudolonga TaxID=143232 RepID=A0AAF0YDH1_9TREE|nr:hypothetical protein LOC62_06G008282 [Vanrija pseudolonga]
MSPSSDYDIPKPSKMKMKESKSDIAQRLYRKEQKRIQREQDKIRRANASNSFFSPPRPARDESISPPRYGPNAGKRRRASDGDDNDEDDWQHTAREDFLNHMDWFYDEELRHQEPGHIFAGWEDFVPARHRPAAASSSSRRQAWAEVDFDPFGPVPPLEEMTENEYTSFIREGLRARLRHAEQAAAERTREARRAEDARRTRERQQQEEKEERGRKRARYAEWAAKEEHVATERAKRADPAKDAAARTYQRSRWRAACTALMVDGEAAEVVAVELTFDDIPWPVYRARPEGDYELLLGLDDLTIDNVRAFLFALADDEAKDGKTTDARRKVLRDAIRLFHPDRFYGRVLPRVREKDRERVREGVERCSRLINELLAAK